MTIDSPKVSILIPVYNRAQYLSACLFSALRQTLQDIEVIIVDNCSDDGTWQLCLDLQASDSRIRVYQNQKNIGPVRNWMRCAELARAPFSKLLFSDDLLEPNCLLTMLPWFDNDQIGLVYCAATIGASKEYARCAYSTSRKCVMPASHFLHKIFCHQAPVSPGAVLLRTKDLRSNLCTDFPTSSRQPFASHGAGPDVLLLLRTADQYGLVASTGPEPLVFFRDHSGSFTCSDVSGLISQGYRSALAYYLIHTKRYVRWFSYLASLWLDDFNKFKTFKPFRQYLLCLQGSGSLTEVFIFSGFLSFKAFSRLVRKLFS